VLGGGLAPKYLCGDLAAPRTLPRPVTLDADLGATRCQYGSLKMDLQAHGYSLSRDEFGGPRFVKTIGDFTVPADF